MATTIFDAEMPVIEDRESDVCAYQGLVMCWAGLKPKARPMLWDLHGLRPGFIFLKPKAWAQARALTHI